MFKQYGDTITDSDIVRSGGESVWQGEKDRGTERREKVRDM